MKKQVIFYSPAFIKTPKSNLGSALAGFDTLEENEAVDTSASINIPYGE
ncbi:MAG: hypothetical protein MI742_07765 [Desulfobacterales bacterium]|nr:hypothetical protein [Desulfobacterales bacterium]